jgi:hypothetical protein
MKTLTEVINWLEDELENNQPILYGTEELSDGTEMIFYGRSELAEALLKQIKGD